MLPNLAIFTDLSILVLQNRCLQKASCAKGGRSPTGFSVRRRTEEEDEGTEPVGHSNTKTTGEEGGIQMTLIIRWKE